MEMSKADKLSDCANQLRGVIEHLNELECVLGTVTLLEEAKTSVPMPPPPSLSTITDIVNNMPGIVAGSISEIHAKINNIRENLV